MSSLVTYGSIENRHTHTHVRYAGIFKTKSIQIMQLHEFSRICESISATMPIHKQNTVMILHRRMKFHLNRFFSPAFHLGRPLIPLLSPVAIIYVLNTLMKYNK